MCVLVYVCVSQCAYVRACVSACARWVCVCVWACAVRIGEDFFAKECCIFSLLTPLCLSLPSLGSRKSVCGFSRVVYVVSVAWLVTLVLISTATSGPPPPTPQNSILSVFLGKYGKRPNPGNFVNSLFLRKIHKMDLVDFGGVGVGGPNSAVLVWLPK